MQAILTALDHRFPIIKAVEFEAWEQASLAGDRVSQYRLGRSLLDAGNRSNLEQGRSWLWRAAGQGFAPAQYWLGELARCGLLPGAKPGASWLWTARAAASAWRTRAEGVLSVGARLKPLARTTRRLQCGERHKLGYSGWWGRPALCAVEIAQTVEGGIAVMLQSLKNNGGTSVANMVQNLAFRALVELLLEGYDADPSAVTWYEVWPADAHRTAGCVHRVALRWDARRECYHDPKWSAVASADIPFDVSHAVLDEASV